MNKILITALIMIFSINVFAQDVTIPNVSDKIRKYRGVEKVDGLGYYCFVLDEDSDKGFKLFNLYIWDYDLKQIAKSSLQLEKKSIIIDAVFNGSNFLVVFYDAKKDNVRSVSFDKTGKKIADVLEDGIKTKFMIVEDMQPSFYAAGDQGFYGIIPDKEGKFGFRIKKYTNDLKVVWTQLYFPEKGVQVVMDAKSDNNKLIVLKYSKDAKYSKRMDVDLTAFGSVDGTEMWTYDLTLSDKILLPTEMTITENGSAAIGGMYFDGEKISGMNSDGIFFAYVDNSGAGQALKTIAWEGELQKFLKESKQSMTVGKPKIIFEDIVYNAATKEFKIVGEMFTVGTLGKVLSFIGGSDPNAETKVTMEDILVFTFTDKGELKDFYSVNKARANIWIPQSFAGGMSIASALKQTGSLPYKFTSLDENGEAIAFYIDYVRLDENGVLTNQVIGAKLIGSAKLGVGMLNLSQSSAEKRVVKYLPVTKKAGVIDENSDVEFDSKRSIIQVTEAKPGFVLISQLSKKTKTLNMFLEEIK
jgi:hypothetical protein